MSFQTGKSSEVQMTFLLTVLKRIMTHLQAHIAQRGGARTFSTSKKITKQAHETRRETILASRKRDRPILRKDSITRTNTRILTNTFSCSIRFAASSENVGNHVSNHTKAHIANCSFGNI